MRIPNDPKLLDVACDVAIRFRGHGSYGDQNGAMKAMRRRAPGHTTDEYRSVLEFLIAVHDRAVAAIARHPADRPDKTTQYARAADIDFDACLAELDEIEPGLAVREKGWILNWCIFWHYLK
ncbi:MAG: hypothetical protein ACYC61_13375 [Isosphaeraceae bacterium]